MRLQVQRLVIVVTALFLTALISCAHQKNEGLLESPYKGSLENLFSQRVGSFDLFEKREINPSGPKRDAMQSVGLTDAMEGIYTTSNKYLELSVFRFSSTEDAVAMMKKMKGGPCSAKESGPKNKKGVTLGERFVWECKGNNGTVNDSGIMWNNGSVVFAISAEPRATELQRAGIGDFLEFEMNFPY